MNRLLLSVFFVLGAFSCRTALKVIKNEPTAEKYVPGDECNVFDFINATEVPENAANLGRVEVRQEEGEDDDATVLKLRQRICALGGNAMSDARWVRADDETEPRILRANAWLMQ